MTSIFKIFKNHNLWTARVTEVYGGKGKVKVRRRLWGAADEKDPKKYSVKYLGPERAAAVLEKALRSVKVYHTIYSSRVFLSTALPARIQVDRISQVSIKFNICDSCCSYGVTQSPGWYNTLKQYNCSKQNIHTSVQDLQGKSSLWKFTQRLEVSTVAA